MRPSDSPEVDLSKMEEYKSELEGYKSQMEEFAQEIEGYKLEISRLKEDVARLEAERAHYIEAIPRRGRGEGDRVEDGGGGEDGNEGIEGNEGNEGTAPSSALVLYKPKPQTEVEKQRRRLSIDFGETFISPSDAPLVVIRAITRAINKMEWEELAVSYIDTIKASSGNVKGEVGEWFDLNFPNDPTSREIVSVARDNFKTCLGEVAVKLWNLNYVGLISFIFSAGLILTDDNFDVARSPMVGSQKFLTTTSYLPSRLNSTHA